MKFCKMLGLALLTLVSSDNASEAGNVEMFVADVEQNISVYLESVIVQADAQGMSDETGLVRILKDMHNELKSKPISEKLQEQDIINTSEALYIDAWVIYGKIVYQVQDMQLSIDEQNELVHKEFSELLNKYFPELVLPFPDFSIRSILDHNAHISAEKCKNIGYVALAALKLWSKQEKVIQN